MTRYVWDHHATKGRANASPFAGSGNTRNCMTCHQWRSIAGGGTHQRTGQWECSCCRSTRLLKTNQNQVPA